MNRIQLLLLLLLAVVAVPFAAADTIQLNQNNLGISGSIGTVTLTQQAGGVQVTIATNAGFSIKLQGGDILFNTSASISAGSITNMLVDGVYVPTFKFNGSSTRAGFTFTNDITDLNKGTLPHGYTSANTVSFFVTGVTVAQLEQGSPEWGIHFCVGGDVTHTCGLNTGFATNGGNQVVPEPGTLSLLGTGLVGIGGFMRRRFFN